VLRIPVGADADMNRDRLPKMLRFFNYSLLVWRKKEQYRQRSSVLSFACAKERTKEKHTGNDPDSYRDSHCRTPWL